MRLMLICLRRIVWPQIPQINTDHNTSRHLC